MSLKGHYLVTSAALLSALVTPVVVMGAGSGPTAQTAGKKKSDPVQIQVRNRSRGETGLVTVSDGYSMRLSNKQVGDGGGAIYGCRSATGKESCVNADNLNTGLAFFFRSQKGATAGRIEASGGANAKPFTTNATGVATGLNADQVDGQSADEVISNARGGGACPQGTANANVGSCVELATRASQSYSDAAKACGSLHRRLPTPGELIAFAGQQGVTFTNGENELTGNLSEAGGTFSVITVSPAGAPGIVAFATAANYRCAIG